MDFFYDILINMNEEKAFDFYEWENYDPIELVKKIPLYRVSTNTLKDFYAYNIKISEEFLNKLLDKTIINNNKLSKTIKYACLLCDTKNCLVVEFNNEGLIISRSCLLLDDEANVLEFIYSYKEIKIEYEKKDKLIINTFLKQEKTIKKFIDLELKTLFANNNENKLKYLFNEWFGYEEESTSEIKKKMIEELQKEFTEEMYYIYKVIKKSYNNV